MSPGPIYAQGQNHLLRTLAPADRHALDLYLTRVDLPERMVLDAPGALIRSVWFLTGGIGSMIALGPANHSIETGLFGCEGMSGMAVAIGGDHQPTRTIMQVGGGGWRIDAEKLREVMDARPSVRAHLLRFVQAMFAQASQTALANGHATLEERLARWLLMCHDRTPGNEIDLTHDFLAIMLGVRRAGVTVGTHKLEGHGLIRADRGRITILDREGLESHAHGFYGASEEEYARLLATDELTEHSLV